jgi:predicted esterase YcpF (UPF0227 family)
MCAARPPRPQLAIIAKGDEVLDWREMVARYPQAQLRLLEGGDHALSDFDRPPGRRHCFSGIAVTSKKWIKKAKNAYHTSASSSHF